MKSEKRSNMYGAIGDTTLELKNNMKVY